MHTDSLRRWIGQGLIAGARLPSGRWRVDEMEANLATPPADAGTHAALLAEFKEKLPAVFEDLEV